MARAKKRAGRPSTNRKIIDAYIANLRRGHGPTTAARLAGLSWDTVQNHRKREEFLRRENHALAAFADKCIRTVHTGVRTDPSLALRVLERRVPEDWAKREVLQGDPTKPFVHEVRDLRAAYAEGHDDGDPEAD